MKYAICFCLIFGLSFTAIGGSTNEDGLLEEYISSGKKCFEKPIYFASGLVLLGVCVIGAMIFVEKITCCNDLGFFCGYSGPSCKQNRYYWAIHNSSGDLTSCPHPWNGCWNYEDAYQLTNIFWNIINNIKPR